MIHKNITYSFEDNLSFENLSLLLNNLSIITHPMTNEQKVCIEYPNINIENKNINIFIEEKNFTNKQSSDEFIINLSKTKKYEIDPRKLYDEFTKKIPYSFEDFKNSLKIFISIFNTFNEDIFKWDLTDFNLFTNNNMIQFLKFNKENKNKTNSFDYLGELYKKHFSITFDFQKTEIIEVCNGKNDSEINNDNVDDFEKDFIDKDEIKNDGNNCEKNNELYSYEKDCVFRNLFFLINLFNLMNKFVISEYNLDNILKNISKFNSYIINDYKILLLIFFHLAVQINLYIKQANVNNFLKIKESETTEAKNNSKEKIIINNFYPNIFFYDYQEKEPTKDENELKKEKIVLFNIILKLFNLTYLTKVNSNLKINIKIFSMRYFSEIKSKLILSENYFINTTNINYLFEFISNKQFVELFIQDSKKYFSIVIFEFILLPDIDINIMNNLILIYYPFIKNSDFISFDTLENDSNKVYPLNFYLNEIVILSYVLKLIIKAERDTKKSKFAFTFVFNSFSVALRKHINNDNAINIQDLMIYMGIYHYNENDMVEYISDDTNYYALYKKYKEILKNCGEYKNYNINIRLFKNGIINKELQYHFISLILNILNNIKIKNKTFYKNISLYESKFINTIKCIYIRIKRQNKEENLISKSSNNNINIENNHEQNAISSPKKKRGSSILGKLFKTEKKKEVINSVNIFKVNDYDNLKKIKQKFNNFYKNLTNCSFLSKLESEVLIKFFNSVKNYFTDFMFYIERINLQNNNNNENKFIFENAFDSSISFDPINILRNFNNNKCFIILKEFSYIDLYIYLYDFYQNNIEDENFTEKSESDIYNDIFNNINILREKCYKNFLDKKKTNCSIVIGKLNFIIQKSFLISHQYFEGNKVFFRNDNKIIILDKYTNTDCILDNGHIDILLNNNNINTKNNDKNNNEIKEENILLKFYTTFLYEYDIIKYIVDKKFIKANKLNIIIKNKILQINKGKIQLKKINLYNNNKNNKNIENDDKTNSYKQDNDKLKYISNENYNLFKIRDLFKYQNSYPLIIFFLKNESEISNFHFLLFSFYEIFLNKQYQELTKELLLKRINQFFYRFKNVKFIPIIFSKKYLKYFLDLFNLLINRNIIKSSSEIIDASDTSKKNLININKYIFENIILFPIELSNILNQDEYNIIFNQDIFNKLTKSISIYNIENLLPINYDINQIGKMFKLNRINNTLTELEKSSNNVIFEENSNINIYKINCENLKLIIKKNQKKFKFIGLDEENRTFNVHIFDSEDTLKKYKLENNNNEENCIVL